MNILAYFPNSIGEWFLIFGPLGKSFGGFAKTYFSAKRSNQQRKKITQKNRKKMCKTVIKKRFYDSGKSFHQPLGNSFDFLPEYSPLGKIKNEEIFDLKI